jgi:energy-coupling factor transport system substrate-specific component
MSWQLGAFAILGLALAAGFAWYERTRPDARIVALVATLAALAALGRIAFVALPNVKPTTDIVLISGYALGGAPGFVVGALAGLTSNFFFGQGPWTPWQMAAWGVTGLIGAGLATATRGRIGRWPLALACAVVGFAFAAVQDVGDWVTFSDHSGTQLGVYVGKGLGFDLIHAAGCLVFALAFGPALTRSIARFAQRLKVAWRTLDRAVLGGLLIACAVALAPPSARGAATPSGYLLANQNRDGGFGPAPGAASSGLYSGWVALGLAAAGREPQSVSRGGASLLAYVRGSGTADVGAVERSILVLRAAGLPAGGLVARLEGAVRRDGSVEALVDHTSFAILALRAAGVAPSRRTIDWLVRQQNDDGGFGFARGAASDVDDSGSALEALAGAPGAAGVRRRAVAFVRGQQNRDGGFPAQADGDSNAQSTAWAMQGLVAAGASGSAISRGLAYLRALSAGDGHIRYSRDADQTPVWVTAQALMALALKPLPLLPPAPVVHHRAAPRGAVHHAPTVAAPRRPAVAGAVHVTHEHKAPAPKPRAAVHARAPALIDYAGDAALATALLLAPVGAG